MIVTKENLESVFALLKSKSQLSLDTETTGLRPFHGDRLFSLIIGEHNESYYFNFQHYPGIPDSYILENSVISRLQTELFSDPSRTWYLHNAKFDLHILGKNDVRVAGKIHCTEALARVVYNEHLTYSLEACAARIGYQKSDAVEEYIAKHKLWEWKQIPGKKQRTKDKFFYKVPFEVIQPYGEQDAKVTFALAKSQEKALSEVEASNPKRPSPWIIAKNEMEITKVCYEMESVGVKIDSEYCSKAAVYEEFRMEKAAQDFLSISGIPFTDSNVVLAKAFTQANESYPLTEKGNPSFEGEVLKTFKSPLAKKVLEYRDAKSRANFYNGFLYFMDANGCIHPNMRQAGTTTGRFSYSDPNLQNLTEESESDNEFKIRKSLIPRDGFCWVSIDFDQLEYRLMLDYSGEDELIEKVKSGLDIHTATAQMMGVDRKYAKTLNFMLLYGGGAQKLADALGISLNEAKALKAKYFSALPKVQYFIKQVTSVAERRSFIFNKYGRIYHFPNSEFAYTAPNRLIQGTGGDTTKIAMVRVYEFLKDKKSRMILNVHDELDFEIHESELGIVPEIKKIVESVFPYEKLPLTASVSHSWKSFGDLEEGLPNVEKTRIELQG